MTRAVVLGSGGIVGGAWEIGVLKGLQEAGIDLDQADLFVGSSIGATLAAFICSGRSISQVYEWRLSPESSGRSSSIERSEKDNAYFHQCLDMWKAAGSDLGARMELGKRALGTPNPIPESDQISRMRARLGRGGWPSRDLKIGAVDVFDGSVRFFSRDDGVPIEVALAASSAQPGLQEPITIGKRRYMDGGIAGTGISGAAGCRVVVAITAFPGAEAENDMREAQASGGQAIKLAPDHDAREAMGGNLSDFSRARLSAEAGIRQGLAFNAVVASVWSRERGGEG